MNAHSIYSELRNQNDRLLDIRSRLRRTVTRICGPAPAAAPGAAAPAQAKVGELTFLDELAGVSEANSEILSDISNDLLWLESVFGTGADAPSVPAPESSGKRWVS